MCKVAQQVMASTPRPSGVPAIRRFACGDRLPVQAQRIWLILTGLVSARRPVARGERTITYGQLALRMGHVDARAGHMLSRQLGIVGNYCLMNSLPALNAMVVNAQTGEPGGDVVLTPGRMFRQELDAIHRQDWYEVGVPTSGTLRKVWESM